jgi:hypothetical protein
MKYLLLVLALNVQASEKNQVIRYCDIAKTSNEKNVFQVCLLGLNISNSIKTLRLKQVISTCLGEQLTYNEVEKLFKNSELNTPIKNCNGYDLRCHL